MNAVVILKYLFAILFVVAGSLHFLIPKFYLKMMPPYIPFHKASVALSGVLEIGLGVLLLLPQYSHLAAWGLIGLLIAVFPANLYMAMHPDKFPEMKPVSLYMRLPIQGLLIYGVYLLT